MIMDRAGFDRGGEHNIAEARDAQVIAFHHVDEWALFILLEDKFGANKFKIEVSHLKSHFRIFQQLTLP